MDKYMVVSNFIKVLEGKLESGHFDEIMSEDNKLGFESCLFQIGNVLEALEMDSGEKEKETK